MKKRTEDGVMNKDRNASSFFACHKWVQLVTTKKHSNDPHGMDTKIVVRMIRSVGRKNSVGMATCYGLDGPGIETH
jgi:hypothetical protein